MPLTRYQLKYDRKEGMLWQDDMVLYTDITAIYLMSELMESKEFDICRINSGPDDNKIINLTTENIKRIAELKSGDILKDIKVLCHENKV